MNLLLCIALSLAPLSPAAQDLDPKGATAENVSKFKLKDTIDASIRWMRARQSGDGSYEEKVMTTSIAVGAVVTM